MDTDIFQAARSGDRAKVEIYIRQGAELSLENKYGFTALHCAAMGCERMSEETAVAMLDLLLNAGSQVNAPSRDGRTAMYLAAEFSRTLGPLKRLIQAGAETDIRNQGGVHIVVNAQKKEIQEFLSALTGHPIPEPRPELPSVKLDPPAWRAVKIHLDRVFDQLARSGLIVLQDAGTTQEDGFYDCSEEMRAREGLKAAILGFCFYTRQDLNRAKRTSSLSLAYWGAPDGSEESMLKVGQQIVDAFRNYGFIVEWNGSSDMRPAVYLQNFTTQQKTKEEPEAIKNTAQAHQLTLF